ncbi:hypothetical protein WJX79_010001 [Trebouxia sp. C0005]
MPRTVAQASHSDQFWLTCSLTNELHCKAAYGIYLQQQVEAGVPGAVEALLQSLGASTKQDEDTYLFKNQTRQLSIIDGPNADNTAPAPEHVKKKAKSAEESHQPATLSGSGKLETTVRNEVQKQLAIHREQEEKRTTFLAKAPLLRLASDILSFTLAAVLPPPTANNSIDIWSSPLAQDNQLAGHVKKMCQRNKCPVSEQRLAIEFNQIRRDKHEAVHAITWDSLIEEADQFVRSPLVPHQSFGSGISWPTGLSRMPSSLSRYLTAVFPTHRQSPISSSKLQSYKLLCL